MQSWHADTLACMTLLLLRQLRLALLDQALDESDEPETQTSELSFHTGLHLLGLEADAARSHLCRAPLTSRSHLSGKQCARRLMRGTACQSKAFT